MDTHLDAGERANKTSSQIKLLGRRRRLSKTAGKKRGNISLTATLGWLMDIHVWRDSIGTKIEAN